MSRSRRHVVARALAVPVPVVVAGTAVFVLDRLSADHLRDVAAPTSVWWPPAFVGFAVVLFVARRRRPVWLVAMALANALAYRTGGLPAADAAFYAVLNVADGALAAAVFVSLGWRGARRLLHDAVDTVRLVAACVAGAGAAALTVAGWALLRGFGDVLGLTRGYLVAHLVGLAVATPALVLAPRTRTGWRELLDQPRRNVEWAAHLAVTSGLCAWLFFGPAHPSDLVLVIVPLLVATTRLDPLRAMTVVAGYGVFATLGTVRGHGALGALADPTGRQWAVQLFIGASAVLGLYATLTARARAHAMAGAGTAERIVTRAFEMMPQPICVTSLDPQRHGEIYQVNQALCDLLGRTRDELIGRSSRTLVTTPPSPAGAALSREMIAGQIDRQCIERTMIAADGTPIPVTQDIAVVRPDDRAAYLVVAITDLRPDREAQAMLLDALRAEADAATALRRAAESRKSLAARTTHDLRTPLMSVQGYLDLLLEDVRVADDQRAMLEVAVRNTERVLELVDDLVTIAGLEGADPSLDRADRHVSPDAVVAAAIDSITPICARKRQALVRPDSPTGMTVEADRTMLERALLNVLSNASKYTPDGGTVTVRTVTDGDRVRIAVSDTGIGVSAEDLPRVGEQFFRAGTALDSDIPGTGLGLAVTRAVLERHGGALDIASTPGIGTTVTLSLPAVGRRFAPVPLRELPRRIAH